MRVCNSKTRLSFPNKECFGTCHRTFLIGGLRQAQPDTPFLICKRQQQTITASDYSNCVTLSLSKGCLSKGCCALLTGFDKLSLTHIFCHPELVEGLLVEGLLCFINGLRQAQPDKLFPTTSRVILSLSKGGLSKGCLLKGLFSMSCPTTPPFAVAAPRQNRGSALSRLRQPAVPSRCNNRR